MPEGFRSGRMSAEDTAHNRRVKRNKDHVLTCSLVISVWSGIDFREIPFQFLQDVLIGITRNDLRGQLSRSFQAPQQDSRNPPGANKTQRFVLHLLSSHSKKVS